MVNSTIPAQKNPKPITPALALRCADAAKALGISARTLWTLTDKGAVPHVRVGSAVLYPVKELTDWLTKQAKSASDAPVSAPRADENSENIGESGDSSDLEGTNREGGR